uniref:Uncharacterized protein n=1 Tax=Meloidogyne enterolobii TaxID=390850 RepID=A0A6V7TI79_MELEN|nr:unnamed protein product [Meloidogyne enterolobii]
MLLIRSIIMCYACLNYLLRQGKPNDDAKVLDGQIWTLTNS